MEFRRWTAILLGVGIVVWASKPVLPEPSFGAAPDAWSVIALVYLLTGGLLGVPRFTFARATPFWWTVLVSAGLAVPFVLARIQDVLLARPALTISEVTFVLWQPTVLFPFVLPFFAPLGNAERRYERTLVAAIVVGPVLVAIVRAVLVDSNSGFGPGFAVLYYGFWLVFATIAGLPLYLYGRSARRDSRPVIEEFDLHSWRSE